MARRASRLDPLMLLASALVLALAFIALFGERIASYEPIYFVVEHGRDPRPYDPGLVFPLGSDVLGRDLLSLVLAGARATLTIVCVAGLARAASGVLIAAVATWRPARLLAETLADVVGAVPATLVALLIVKAFVTSDAGLGVLIGALLVVGWAGPYRVIRAEVDRLGRAPFTDGARAIGVGRSRLFWRHHLPHLAPVVATNVSQQIVASLVLVAELGVLGVLLGAVRDINVEESLTRVLVGPPREAFISDTPEWGAMLASSRTVEALWATRWLILVPGAAFALTAVAVGFIGFALARRYARRDLFKDARAAGALGALVALMFVVSALVPERYADARSYASAARADVRETPDLQRSLMDAGLRTYAATRTVTSIVRAGPATVRVGAASVAETDAVPPPANRVHVRSLVSGPTGGGAVDAPLVFAARGIVPAAHPPQFAFLRRGATTPDLGRLIRDYPDDYAETDPRGRVVLLVRFMGVDSGEGVAPGFSVGSMIDDVIRRGAAAVIFVDPGVGDVPRVGNRPGVNAYTAIERDNPARRTSGVPVVILHPDEAQRLVAPLGLDLSPFIGFDPPGVKWERSAARDLGVRARVEVPLRQTAVAVASKVAEVEAAPADDARIVLWAAYDIDADALDTTRANVLASIARLAEARKLPFVFVESDRRADAAAVRDALADKRVGLVLVLDDLHGDTLTFKTANGDLIPAIDLYAAKAAAKFEVTRSTAPRGSMTEPFPDARTIEIGATGEGRSDRDAAAVIGYLAGRLALGAPEVPR